MRSSETSEAVEEFQVAPRGFFEVSRRNLFGKDRSINLFTRVSFRPKGVSASPNAADQSTEGGGYGFNEYLARVTYGERRILGTEADATISAGVEQGVRSSFDFNRRGASATVTRRVSRTLAVSGRYGLDHTRLLNIKSTFAAQPEIDRLFPQVRLSSVSSSLIRDTRNDSIEPNSGSLIGADAELAARRIGSQVGFFKTFLQGFAYRQLPGAANVVAVLGARVGPRHRLPADRRSGGADRNDRRRGLAGQRAVLCRRRQRPFAASLCDRLGTPDTIDPTGFPKGGHGLVVLNAELRIPGARRSGRRCVCRRRQRLPDRRRNGLQRSCAQRSVSAFAIDRRWARFASTWESSWIDACCRAVNGSGRPRCTSAWDRHSDDRDRAEGRGTEGREQRVTGERATMSPSHLISLLFAPLLFRLGRDYRSSARHPSRPDHHADPTCRPRWISGWWRVRRGRSNRDRRCLRSSIAC